MTQREREKLDPLIRAADNMAVILENISAAEAQFTSEGRTNVTAVKTMTAAMKELISVIRNLNELPSKAEREASKMAREKFELDKRRSEGEEKDSQIRLVVECGEDLSI